MRAYWYTKHRDVTCKMAESLQQFYLRLIRLIIYRNFKLKSI